MRRLRALLAPESGQAMILAVFTFVILTTFSVALADVISNESSQSVQDVSRNAAYQAAEAGIDEYISKLLEDPLYYQHYVDDAESTRNSGSLTVAGGGAWTGGLTWTYPNGKDNWQTLGNGYAYNLEITGPSGSSSQLAEAVQILSTGCRWNTTTSACQTGTTAAQREIQTALLPSSAASWQMIANTSISYGSAATTTGRVYVNGNLTHDGTATANLYATGSISGAVSLQNGATEYDSNSNPSVSTEVPGGINFSTFVESNTEIQRAATYAGVYLSQASPPAAWEIVFNSNGTFTAAACSQVGSSAVWLTAPSCGTATTYSMPANGAIYSAQTVIIGSASSASTVDGRVTVTSGTDIVIGNDISYLSGSNSVLGLVASDDMVVAGWAPSTLSWNAATVTESGQWTDACGESSQDCGSKSSMTFTGSTATYAGGSMSEFNSRTYNFDSNLTWLDPPWFPTIENPYTVLLQREIPVTP